MTFGAGGSPSLRVDAAQRRAVRAVSRQRTGSVYDAWRRMGQRRRRRRAGDGRSRAAARDFAGFYNHLGIPHADWGFGGPGGVYHSQYDTYEWMTTFGDTAFEHHAAAARDRERDAAAARERRHPAVRLRGVRADDAAPPAGAGRASSRACAASAAVERRPRRGDRPDGGMRPPASPRRATRRCTRPSPARSACAANAALREVERALTRPEGLRTRPWYRTLIYAADENNGYSNVVFPSVVEAARRGDAALAASELADLADALRRGDGGSRACAGGAALVSRGPSPAAVHRQARAAVPRPAAGRSGGGRRTHAAVPDRRCRVRSARGRRRAGRLGCRSAATAAAPAAACRPPGRRRARRCAR